MPADLPVPTEKDRYDAARAYCLSRYDYDGPYIDDAARAHHIDSDARSTASDNAALIAAVDSAYAAGWRAGYGDGREAEATGEDFPAWVSTHGDHGTGA